MEIQNLIQFLENRLNMLEQSKNSAFSTGDFERFNQIELELEQTKITLNKLKTLS